MSQHLEQTEKIECKNDREWSTVVKLKSKTSSDNAAGAAYLPNIQCIVSIIFIVNIASYRIVCIAGIPDIARIVYIARIVNIAIGTHGWVFVFFFEVWGKLIN